MLGTTVGNYTITAKIGQGGMAVVYTAQHADLDRKAVVKVLRRHLLSDDEIPRRFRNEASAIASIKHPGIVTVMDFGELEDGNLYILMEFLDGENLRERLDRTPGMAIAVTQAMTITRQAADALAAAHASNIVHRDLKPANIFLTRDAMVRNGERVKLLDFGIAKIMDRSATASLVTKSNVIMGTPIYMSPEQCRGAGEVDHRTDLYALGCILFEMLCGRPPFDTKAAGELIVLHLTQPPPAARSINSAVPVPLDELISRLLAKEPGDRLASASELVAALDRIAASYSDGIRAEQAQMVTPYASAPSAGVLPTGSAVEFEPTELDHNMLGLKAIAKAHSNVADVVVAPTEKFDLDMQAAAMVRGSDRKKPNSQPMPVGPSGSRNTATPPRMAIPKPSDTADEFGDDSGLFGSKEVTTPWAHYEGQPGVFDRFQAQNIATQAPMGPAHHHHSSPIAPMPAVAPGHVAYQGQGQSQPQHAQARLTPPAGRSAQHPQGPFGETFFPAGRLTLIGRSRTWWLAQVLLLCAACTAGVVYLIVRVVASVDGTTQSPAGQGGSLVSDGGVTDQVIKPSIISPKTKYRPALVALSKGTFTMGSPQVQQGRSKDETPQHLVTLSPFLLCNTEVTQGQWKAVMGENPSECEYGCKDEQPVHNVNWYNAVDYYNKLSSKEQLEPCYERTDDVVVWKRPCSGYRFPTEAEWEYAARAGTTTIFSFGDASDGIGDYAWYSGNTQKVQTVATKKPNPWGLFDMHGNVYEWVWDQFERFYPEEHQFDPIGVPRKEPKRVLRGGSFRNDPKDLRSAVRYPAEEVSSNWDIGLRCARNAPAQP